MEMPQDVLDTVQPFAPDLIDTAIYGPEAAETFCEVSEDDVAEVLGWTPPSIEYADWAGRKWVANRAEADEIDRIAREQIDRIKAWQTAEKARLDRKLNWLEAVLQRYAIARRVATKAATTKLPSVTISTRQVAGGVDVVDEAAVIEWAETNGYEAAVKIKKSFLKSVLPKSILESVAVVATDDDGGTDAVLYDPKTGEAIPGLRPRAAGLSATIKPSSI